MSAPAKEPQPLGSTTGKREDVRICVRCGYERKKAARSFAGPYMTNPRPADVATRAAAKAQVGEDRLRLLSNVADWAGISYGQLMLKSPAEREVLILAYKTEKGGNAP